MFEAEKRSGSTFHTRGRWRRLSRWLCTQRATLLFLSIGFFTSRKKYLESDRKCEEWFRFYDWTEREDGRPYAEDCLLSSSMFLRALSSSPTSRLIISSRLISRNRFIHTNNFNRTSQPTRQSRLTRISISATAALFSTSTQLNNQQQQSDNMAPVSTNGTSNGSQKKHKVVSKVQDSLMLHLRLD